MKIFQYKHRRQISISVFNIFIREKEFLNARSQYKKKKSAIILSLISNELNPENTKSIFPRRFIHIKNSSFFSFPRLEETLRTFVVKTNKQKKEFVTFVIERETNRLNERKRVRDGGRKNGGGANAMG